MRTIDDLGDLTSRRVLVRSDLNVPLDGSAITDDGRIRASVPTIDRLRKQGARVIVMSHLGRPKGQPEQAYTLRPVADRLAELIDAPVAFASDTVGEHAVETTAGLRDGEVAVLENVRFSAAETAKDDAERGAFAAQLAGLADAFVSDGFGVVHRKQASVYDIARLLPHAAGLLVEAEVAVLKRLTEAPERPFVVVLGGSKVSDKLGVIESLLHQADKLLIGGAMVFTFLRARGFDTGESLVEEDHIETCRTYLRSAADEGVEIILPTDVVVAPEMSAESPPTVVTVDAMPADQIGLDIGPEAGRSFAAAIADARTVFWNGPMGVFEHDAFAGGTRAVADALTRVDGLSVVGGGDSAAAIRKLGFNDDQFGHVSTGGGASLEYVEGKTLPGLEVLADGSGPG